MGQFVDYLMSDQGARRGKPVEKKDKKDSSEGF